MSKLNKFEDIKSRIQSSIPTTAHNELIEDAITETGVNVKKFRARRAKFEDNYTRATFYIENNMLEWLNNATAGSKGLKTEYINEALMLLQKKLEKRSTT